LETAGLFEDKCEKDLIPSRLEEILGSGLVRLASKHSFAETYERLESEVSSRGLTVFARIDFDGDAEKAGLKMPPTRLLVFGNPITGTPLMVAAPSLAIDLPLKILVSDDENGKTWVTYNSPQYLKTRHNIPDQLFANVAGVVSVAQSVVG
jgi:uncharacterized protein (DUF302 family)